MNKKILLAMAAMLGFSTACSTIKSTSKGSETPKNNADTTAASTTGDTPRRVIVMYGVRPPVDESGKTKKLEVLKTKEGQKPSNPRYEVDPVAEEPRD